MWHVSLPNSVSIGSVGIGFAPSEISRERGGGHGQHLREPSCVGGDCGQRVSGQLPGCRKAGFQRTLRTLDRDPLLVVGERTLGATGPAGLRDRDGLDRSSLGVRADDVRAGGGEFVAVVGLVNESARELVEVVVELPGVTYPDGLAQLRKRCLVSALPSELLF